MKGSGGLKLKLLTDYQSRTLGAIKKKPARCQWEVVYAGSIIKEVHAVPSHSSRDLVLGGPGQVKGLHAVLA